MSTTSSATTTNTDFYQIDDLLTEEHKLVREAVQQMMNLAVLDLDVAPEHADAVAGRVANLAIAHHDVVGRDLHAVTPRAATIDEVVLISPGFPNLQPFDFSGRGVAADRAAHADRRLGRRRCAEP